MSHGKYHIYEDDYAVIIAKSALLNAEVEGMKICNHNRISKGMTEAYDEIAFYQVMKPLEECLERCVIKEPEDEK